MGLHAVECVLVIVCGVPHGRAPITDLGTNTCMGDTYSHVVMACCDAAATDTRAVHCMHTACICCGHASLLACLMCCARWLKSSRNWKLSTTRKLWTAEGNTGPCVAALHYSAATSGSFVLLSFTDSLLTPQLAAVCRTTSPHGLYAWFVSSGVMRVTLNQSALLWVCCHCGLIERHAC